MQLATRNGRPYRRSRHSQILSLSDRKRALKYLKSPTQTGIFKFDTVKPDYDGLKSVVNDVLDSSKNSHLKAERVGRLFENGIVAMLLFFNYLILVRNKTYENDSIRHSFYNFEYLLDGVDLTLVLNKYKDALDYFEDNIHVQNKDGELYSPEAIFKVKNGFLVYNTLNRSSSDIISLDRQVLENLNQFLQKAGFISASVNIYSIFSPEEELLEPYVDIMDACLSSMPVSIVNQRHLSKAISNYYDDDYTGTVSSAGLVAEEYLSQIYETLAREPVPRNLTLGQLSKQIGATSRAIENPATSKRITQADIIRDIEKIHYTADDKYVQKVAKNILRYVAYATKDLKADLRVGGEGEQSYAIFPRLIKMGLDDLIIYRNAASHKSTESIDSLKALKSLSSSFSIAMWWETTRKTINAADTREEMYAYLASAAKVYE